jgi:hypothetical protein
MHYTTRGGRGKSRITGLCLVITYRNKRSSRGWNRGNRKQRQWGREQKEKEAGREERTIRHLMDFGIHIGFPILFVSSFFVGRTQK